MRGKTGGSKYGRRGTGFDFYRRTETAIFDLTPRPTNWNECSSVPVYVRTIDIWAAGPTGPKTQRSLGRYGTVKRKEAR